MAEFELMIITPEKYAGDWRSMRIETAAVMFEGEVYTMERPARHWHIVHEMARKLGLSQDGNWEQGFLTDKRVFVRRKPAFRIAEHAGQIIARSDGRVYNGPDLFSEDVW